MSSPARLAANRSNARRSSGPRTAAGKSKAKRNALRHGLSAVTVVDTMLAPRIEAIVRRLCGANANPLLREQALIVAENHVLLARVRVLCLATIERHLRGASRGAVAPRREGAANPGFEFGAMQAAMPEIERLERFERRTWRYRSRAIRSFIAIKARS